MLSGKWVVFILAGIGTARNFTDVMISSPF